MKARTAVFWAFLIPQVSLMVWYVYRLWTRQIPVFLGIGYVVVILLFIRAYIAFNRKLSTIDVGDVRELKTQFSLITGVPPDSVESLLGQEEVIDAIKSDLTKTGQISYKELWRLGLITPGLDRFDPYIHQSSRQEGLKEILVDYNHRLNRLGQIPLKRTAVLNSSNYINVQFSNCVITELSETGLNLRNSLRSYSLSASMEESDLSPIRDIQIRSGGGENRGQYLPRFLQSHGFPIRDSYVDGDPLTTERGGIIVIDKGKTITITPKYFVQRRLIDDEGNLVHLGLDESFNHSTMFDVKMQPSVSALLIRCVSSHGYLPVLRYRSFPYASDYMLPILDTPMSCNGWADIFIDTRGKAKLFVAREHSDEGWIDMMNRLKQLLYDELAKKDNHLLGLTKDQADLSDYLSKKHAILEQFYTIKDWNLF